MKKCVVIGLVVGLVGVANAKSGDVGAAEVFIGGKFIATAESSVDHVTSWRRDIATGQMVQKSLDTTSTVCLLSRTRIKQLDAIVFPAPPEVGKFPDLVIKTEELFRFKTCAPVSLKATGAGFGRRISYCFTCADASLIPLPARNK